MVDCRSAVIHLETYQQKIFFISVSRRLSCSAFAIHSICRRLAVSVNLISRLSAASSNLVLIRDVRFVKSRRLSFLYRMQFLNDTSVVVCVDTVVETLILLSSFKSFGCSKSKLVFLITHEGTEWLTTILLYFRKGRPSKTGQTKRSATIARIVRKVQDQQAEDRDNLTQSLSKHTFFFPFLP